MISSSSVYGLKMQWTPEHSQWAEQHFDISSTTRSPAHKAEAYRALPGHLQRSTAYQYAWANDDISALTASNLLKKYAEKYSGILEMPGGYSEAPGVMNGRKGESEPWQDGVYPMSCIPEGVSVRKGGVAAASEVVSGMCSSPGLASSTLSEPSYSSSSCGSHSATALHSSSMASQEYGPAYSGSYLHSSYSSQSAPTPALPSPLHSSGLLQPPPPPPSHPTLVPAYNGGSPNLSSYNYPPAGYPAQSSVGPGYSPGGAPPPSSYLPSGIAAPTPLPPSSTLPGYPYQSHNLTPIAPTPLSSSSSNSLKRKAFYMTGQGEIDSSYANFAYGQSRSSAESPMYRIADSSSANGGTGGGGFDRSAEKSSLPFNPQKQSTMSSEQRKYSSQAAGGPLTPPAYGSSTLGGSRSADSLASFTSPSLSEQSAEDHRLHLSHSAPGPSSSSSSSSRHAEEQLKTSDPHLLDMVTSEIVQQGPPVDWCDIAGLELAKATLKEEVLWPILRPDMFSSLGPTPRCLLLFGPRGSGRTLLGRCLASQLGAPFLQLSGSTLATKWLADGEKIIRASFLVARCRQPSVLFISEVDMLLSAHLSEESPINRLKGELLGQLDSLLMGSGEDGSNQVLVVCSTSRPQDMDEGLRRYFARRVLVPLPDSVARHQIVTQLLAQSQHKYCLSEEELALLVQRTEGFSGLDLARLCQEALVGLLHVSAQGMDMTGMMSRGQIRPLTYQDFESVFCKFQASISQKEIDTYTEWNKMFGCSQ
ncbi:fidgetin-like isoform X1 [Hippoglossus hippoglossus]|uniref:fidgetin-like isoform X1 n=2 Tax=Hippoglossus hippoglossus TaxID=8267 RepID=UPI00148C7464|nr:fidgetin-like isoform X1 [Hippoglossus hippoglossus]XP_034462616.1 fidgetin-like isoform X1 [Hippoglossus hippoglossus]XP_034462625.1 fidgetin-like isoform X1 [Hippoglossus hippoglossus]XP_034462634.1 fidgetin-like isoform X1 [Hippoglossus hippoglossus]XP_034462644.1 fidgetin-like isoform X1 [Hippoglossus hippoglossus]